MLYQLSSLTPSTGSVLRWCPFLYRSLDNTGQLQRDSSCLASSSDNDAILFAIDIPAVGCVFWLCQEQRPIPDLGVSSPAKDNSMGKYTNSVPGLIHPLTKKYFEQKIGFENEFLQ